MEALLKDDSEANFVQPSWNIGGGSGDKDTMFVPTYNHEEEDEVDLKVYNNNAHSPPVYKNHGKNKMRTIKEEKEDGAQSEGSDTAYFGDTHDFNNRDDDEDD